MNAALHYSVNVVFWTEEGDGAELLAYSPLGGQDSTIPLPIQPAPSPVSVVRDLGATPGEWQVARSRYDQEGWLCSQIAWEMIFERTFCWDSLGTVSWWRAPTAAAKFVDILVDITTAHGGCLVVSSNSVTSSSYIRINLTELDAAVGES